MVSVREWENDLKEEFVLDTQLAQTIYEAIANALDPMDATNRVLALIGPSKGTVWWCGKLETTYAKPRGKKSCSPDGYLFPEETFHRAESHGCGWVALINLGKIPESA